MGLWGQRCVRAALYRGQNCRTCPGVVQLPVLCPCCLVQGASLQNMLSGLWACLAWVCVTDHGNTCGHAKWWSAGSTAGVEDLQLTIRKVYLYCWGTCTLTERTEMNQNTQSNSKTHPTVGNLHPKWSGRK